MATTSHNQHLQDGNALFRILINDIVAEMEAGAAYNGFFYEVIEDDDDNQNYDNAIIIWTTFGTMIVIEESVIKILFIRMCRDIFRRGGDNFEVLDFFNGKYDDSLEFHINLATEYFRREFSSVWTPQDQDHLFFTIFDRVREFSFFTVLELLPESLGKMIIKGYLKTRWSDECEEWGAIYGEDDVCPVCLNPLNLDQEVETTTTMIAKLDCGHKYHDDCMVSWIIRRNNTCPLCREKAVRDWKSATMRFQQSLLDC